jgi:DNA polymerase I
MSKFARLASRYIAPATAPTRSSGLRAVFDIEADGLLDAASKVHCIIVADLDSDRIDEYGPVQIPAALAHLASADYLVGHNIINYDLPLLRRLHNWTPTPDCGIVDTLVTSRLILPHLDDLDDQATAMGDPPLGKLRGRYSLEAWGLRLAAPKIGVATANWSVWTPEIQARCVGDVILCKKLWCFLQPDGYSDTALALEHRIAAICERITTDGVPFNAPRPRNCTSNGRRSVPHLRLGWYSNFPVPT